MPYVVDSVWGISCCITPTCRNRIRPKSEKLAAPGPMKGSRTRRVCTLGMLLVIERGYSQRSAGWGWLIAVSPLCSHALFFQALNSGPQPASNCFFDLVLITAAVKGIQRFTGSGYVERNVAAGNHFGAALGWHQVHQNTITARTRILFGIVVHTGERILENILRPPRRPRRTPIATIFEELKFKF